MRRRSPEREMAAWKRRLTELARKEARCAGCAKARRLNADTTLPQICAQHISVRKRMAFKWD
jgi:hypothetical protein